jgi:hypothetical protein
MAIAITGGLTVATTLTISLVAALYPARLSAGRAGAAPAGAPALAH